MIAKYIQKMMEDGGIEGVFGNHSIRKTTCTRLFQKGVDPQLIKEQKGHNSEGMMRYKKSNLATKKQVSDMLTVLPQQMDDIRKSQSKMLEREDQLDREKNWQLSDKNSDLTEVSKRESMVVDSSKGLDVYVPMADGFDFSKLQGLVNIHLHFHSK